MAPISATLIAKDYGYLAPLALGDIRIEGFDISVDRDTEHAIDRTLRDPEVLIGESSISRHVARTANGDTTWVAIPFFLMRAFRHRCFFVRKDSPATSFQDLIGKRVGTDNWMASGNTWSRAAMREQGVDLDQLDWICGPIDGTPQNRPQGNLPPNASPSPAGAVLSAMLRDGELDALMCPDVPAGFYSTDSPFRRLFPNFRDVESAYYARTGMWPGLHLTVIRRSLFESEPAIAQAVFTALEASRQAWVTERLYLNETPWMLEELESSASQLGEDWGRNGITPTVEMVDHFCRESYEQNLIPEKVDSTQLFAEFAAVATR